ncbi:hypothetical protein AO382_2249 [Moraxella catarrhalis]|uniref:Uncharacterized protein n=1 Tax=Moraxella catarrhalis TaxID=480 RepID=A0A7Z0UWH8_MORCA|nr:hypothetical protein AO382_2249 [Moraxella catarrhalis]
MTNANKMQKNICVFLKHPNQQEQIKKTKSKQAIRHTQ